MYNHRHFGMYFMGRKKLLVFARWQFLRVLIFISIWKSKYYLTSFILLVFCPLVLKVTRGWFQRFLLFPLSLGTYLTAIFPMGGNHQVDSAMGRNPIQSWGLSNSDRSVQWTNLLPGRCGGVAMCHGSRDQQKHRGKWEDVRRGTDKGRRIEFMCVYLKMFRFMFFFHLASWHWSLSARHWGLRIP